LGFKKRKKHGKKRRRLGGVREGPGSEGVFLSRGPTHRGVELEKTELERNEKTCERLGAMELPFWIERETIS